MLNQATSKAKKTNRLVFISWEMPIRLRWVTQPYCVLMDKAKKTKITTTIIEGYLTLERMIIKTKLTNHYLQTYMAHNHL